VFVQAEDALDELLLKSPLPEPPAWFVSETLARCRRETQKPIPVAWRVQWRWMMGLLGGTAGLAAVVITAGLLLSVRPAPEVQVAVPTTPAAAADAFMVVATVNSSSSEEECDDASL
jgi:hypothetical protein